MKMILIPVDILAFPSLFLLTLYIYLSLKEQNNSCCLGISRDHSNLLSLTHFVIKHVELGSNRDVHSKDELFRTGGSYTDISQSVLSVQDHEGGDSFHGSNWYP